MLLKNKAVHNHMYVSQKRFQWVSQKKLSPITREIQNIEICLNLLFITLEIVCTLLQRNKKDKIHFCSSWILFLEEKSSKFRECTKFSLQTFNLFLPTLPKGMGGGVVGTGLSGWWELKGGGGSWGLISINKDVFNLTQSCAAAIW